MKKSKSSPPGRWIAIAASTVSCFSLTVSMEQCNEARLHDRPRLTYNYFQNDQGAGWHLINSGLGPARLRGFKIMVDGNP